MGSRWDHHWSTVEVFAQRRSVLIFFSQSAHDCIALHTSTSRHTRTKLRTRIQPGRPWFHWNRTTRLGQLLKDKGKIVI